MSIRLEVLNFLTTDGSQIIGIFPCFAYRQNGWNFFYRDGFSGVNNTYSTGEDWDDCPPVLALRHLSVSLLAMVGVSFSMLIVMSYAVG
ncbi:hypothetical protein [Kaarinaea lacus]